MGVWDGNNDGTVGPTAGFPLTPMQEGMLFHQLQNPASGVDIEQIVCDLRHSVDADLLRRAWEGTLRHIPRLRGGFRWTDVTEPLQFTGNATEVGLTEVGFAGGIDAEGEAGFQAHVERDRCRPFDLTRPPLLRLTLFRLGPSHSRLLVTFPHILMDGRSFPVVLEDAFRRYDAASGAGEVWPGREVPDFREFVQWYSERPTGEGRTFWRDSLRGIRRSTNFLPPGSPGTARGMHGEGGPGERGEVELRLSLGDTAELRSLAGKGSFTLATLVQAAWSHVLGRYSGETDVVFGATRACRHVPIGNVGEMVGVLINTLPVRVRLDPTTPLRRWVEDLRSAHVASRPFEHAPLVEIQQWSGLSPGEALFESLVVFDHALLDTSMKALVGPRWEERSFALNERTSFPVTLYGYGEDRLLLRLAFDLDRLPEPRARAMLELLGSTLRFMAEQPEATVGDLPPVPPSEWDRSRSGWAGPRVALPVGATLHGLVLQRLRAAPDRVVVRTGTESLTGGELDRLSGKLAAILAQCGIGPGDLVGVMLPRSSDLVVTLLAVLRVGAAYLPLDPGYPRDRLEFMLEDSGASLLVTTSTQRGGTEGTSVPPLLLDRERATILAREPAPHPVSGGPEDRAYVIYTSGSTGRPKGVEVEHRNVVNFILAMDRVFDGSRAGPDGQPGTWLSLTSLSFDISVLEIFWTLARGLVLGLHRGAEAAEEAGGAFLVEREPNPRSGSRREAPDGLRMSLFYFSSDGGDEAGDRYRLLLDGARFADANGFSAVWTPERHFHAFGGLFPNPSVAGAALASITERVEIRAGSVVLPLHHPVRVAEEWAMVDNLSGGRVGVSFASGWHPNDFVLAPARHAERKEILFRDLEVVRRLWRGEKVDFEGPDGTLVPVQIFPPPVQEELPIWVTTAGSPETYRRAGLAGTRVLTHLLGQTLEDLAAGISAYREGWREGGHPDGGGYVSLMLHSFVAEGDDEARTATRAPMIRYLRSAVGLVRNFADSWTAYRRGAGQDAPSTDAGFEDLSPEDLDSLLEFAFERYFESSGLFGSVDRCVDLARRVQAVGVDEIACLIDFGVGTDRVLQHLPLLSEVLAQVGGHPTDADGLHGSRVGGPEVFAPQVREWGVTHLQCTPSRLRLLLADPESREALRSVNWFLVGGEALPASLARELLAWTGGRVVNMYGPTETTIWSTCHEVEGVEREGIVPIGRALANTSTLVLDKDLRPVPMGVPGELFIGGRGVVRGYLGRPELTRERFLPDASDPTPGGRMYRTGDLVRFRSDGVLEFLGRTDFQVKLRGHRIELEEVEAILQEVEGVGDAVVQMVGDDGVDERLVAWLVPRSVGGISDDALTRAAEKHVRCRLPSIMVPSRFVVVPALPRTPNDKVDRNALRIPAPDAGTAEGPAGSLEPHHAGSGGEAPNPATLPELDEVEQRVALVWRDLLGVADILPSANFFDLGGHSLLVVRAQARLQAELGGTIRIADLFRHPTLRSLSMHLAGRMAEGNRVEAGSERGAARRRMLIARGGAGGP